MGRLAVMEQNSEKISDEIKVMKDILKFIDDAEKKNGAKRTRLCSNLSSKLHQICQILRYSARQRLASAATFLCCLDAKPRRWTPPLVTRLGVLPRE